MTGILIAFFIILLWGINLFFALESDLTQFSWHHLLFFLAQTHLYTGLFITAHDGMHGTICRNQSLNLFIGFLSAGLFAFNNFFLLKKKHRLHHQFPASEQDPDFARGGFWFWLFSFVKQYISIWQIVLMGISFNLAALIFPKENLLLFWAAPSLLAVLQLFYFGTYLPHKDAPDNVHKARSLSKNHIFAFFSCYFFAYHYEHHDSPRTPWWKLYELKK
jgi:beta-carotene ketolase (CrtW type)